MGNVMQPNRQNRTMWTGNNLEIMLGMNSASVNLNWPPPLLFSSCHPFYVECG